MHLPPAPSDDVLQQTLPWWVRTMQVEAKKLGIQHHSAKVARELWRLQKAIEWTKDGVPAVLGEEDGWEPAEWTADYPQPSEDVLTAFRNWEAVIVESYGAQKTWCDLFGVLALNTWKDTEQDCYRNDGYGVDGYDPDGYDRDGLDREKNPRPQVEGEEASVRRTGPPPWANIAKARKW